MTQEEKAMAYDKALELLDWLEKQKEQKFADKERKTDIEAIEKRAEEVFPDDDDENTPLFRQAFIDGAVDYLDCGCKPAEWTEEDEKLMTAAFLFIEAYGHEVFFNSDKEDVLNWLKSIKERLQ